MRKIVDVFPAVIKVAPEGSVEDFSTLQPVGAAPQGTRKLDRCRVVVLADTLMIVVDSPDGPELVFREKVEQLSTEDGVTHVLTENKKAVAFQKDSNCGCGSRLRSWNPYKSILP
jgi:hypothetical protein